MTNLDRLVNLNLAQWSRPDAERPRLSSPVSEDSTTLIFNYPFKDEDGTIIRGNVLMGIQNKKGYTEGVYTPSGTLAYDAQSGNFSVGLWVTGGTSGARGYVLADSDSGMTGTLTLGFVTGTFQDNEAITDTSTGAATVNGTITHCISADGQTHSNVVRGVDMAGLDFFTQNTASFAVDHEADEPVICQVSAVHMNLLFQVMMGNVATGANSFTFGNGTNSTLTLYHKDGSSTKGILRKNISSGKMQYSDDGTNWYDLSTVGAHGTTALIKDHDDVASSASDSPSDGDLFVYDTTNKWENQTISSALGATRTEISQLSGTTNIAEANTFFGSTDITAAEAEILTNGSDASVKHWHDPVYNRFYSGRANQRISESKSQASTETNNGIYFLLTTAAVNNDWAAKYTNATENRTGSTLSLHNKNPRFFVKVKYSATTAQEGFIGFCNSTMIGSGTLLENSVITIDHFGFVIQDGTLYISVADGTTQQKTDISTGLNITHAQEYYATFDGTTASFYVNGTLKGTLNTNVPDNNLAIFYIGVIADASAAAKSISIYNDSVFSWEAN